MELEIRGRRIVTEPMKNILIQGEKNIERPKLTLPKMYDGTDISGLNFILRAASKESNTVAEQQLVKTVGIDTITLTWTVNEQFSAVEGVIYLELRGINSNSTIVFKAAGDPIYVTPAIGAGSLPGPDLIQTAIDNLYNFVVDAQVRMDGKIVTATEKANTATAKAAEAANSATAANNSKAAAAASAAMAGNNATAADNSKKAAATSEANALAYKNAAETAKTAAQAAKTAAETAKTAAEASKTAAAGSASTATTQAGIATTKANTATEQADLAEQTAQYLQSIGQLPLRINRGTVDNWQAPTNVYKCTIEARATPDIIISGNRFFKEVTI